MNNGHNNAIFSTNPDMENSLNEENWRHSLEISTPVDMPSPESLKKTENEPTLESAPYTEAPSVSTSEMQLEKTSVEAPSLALGQIAPMSERIDPAITRVNYNPTNVRTIGDHLDKATIAEVNHVMERLDQTGDLNNFYEEIRGEGSMLEANLNNSFNRKLYDEGETK